MTELKQKIISIMADIFELDAADIPDNASAGVVENWDSIRHMNLIVALEEEFNVRFNDTDIVDLITIPLIESIIKEMKSS
jgi:acyl carrier protein